jgi:hypothetical protein
MSKGESIAHGPGTAYGLATPRGQALMQGWDIQPESAWKHTEGRDPR